MAQLPQTFPKKNRKTSFLNKDQKVELVIRFFSDYSDAKTISKKPKHRMSLQWLLPFFDQSVDQPKPTNGQNS